MSVLPAMSSSHSLHRTEPALGLYPLHAYGGRARGRSVSPHFSASPKKRSHSDSCPPRSTSPVKRSRTAPSSPPSGSDAGSRLDRSPFSIPQSLAAPAARSSVQLPRINPSIKQSINPSINPSIKLPSINAALASLPAPRHVVPTVSLDYFDTYKPNDENWRYGLLDSIRNARGPGPVSAPTSLPSIRNMHPAKRPQFDSRVGSKSFPSFPQQRKINFPYESNYTYLNSTYMKDVEKFPEYLELAQSLVQLSRPAPQAPGYRYQYADACEAFASRYRPGRGSDSFEKGHNMSTSIASTNSISTSTNSTSTNSTSTNSTNTNGSAASKTDKYTLPPTPQYSYRSAASPARSRYRSPESYEPKSPSSVLTTKFIPITPPSVKDKTRTDLMKSPPKNHASPRVCISCGSDSSPCWRPSWSTKEGQLCNSCGLRYKKTAARCLNDDCRKIPAKGEWSLMQSEGTRVFDDGSSGFKCLDCGGKVEVSTRR